MVTGGMETVAVSKIQSRICEIDHKLDGLQRQYENLKIEREALQQLLGPIDASSGPEELKP